MDADHFKVTLRDERPPWPSGSIITTLGGTWEQADRPQVKRVQSPPISPLRSVTEIVREFQLEQEGIAYAKWEEFKLKVAAVFVIAVGIGLVVSLILFVFRVISRGV